jgi:MFS family permease
MSEPTITPADTKNLRWYQGLDRYCWLVLVIAALGWLFDTMDQNLFNLVRRPSVVDLLRPHYLNDAAGLDAKAKSVAGILTSVFLIGWSVGGFLFGIIGDRLGRAKTMIVTILIYAVFTGLSGVANNWYVYALFRFLTALGVGGEFAAGASLVAETFPSRSRPMALGSLQALSAVGNMMAAIITLVISAGMGGLDTHWRWAYFVGALPAVLVFWIAKDVREPEAWRRAKEQASVDKELGSIGQLFDHPVLRRHTIAGVLLATAGVGGLWGVGFFSPDMLNTELRASGVKPTQIGNYTSIMYFVQQVGAFLGCYAFAMFTERTSRRLAFTIGYALSWVSVLAFFWAIQGAGSHAFGRAMILAPIMGFCTLGPFSGFTIYFPELFPTRLRATGCGFCYNAARVLAAAAPFVLGALAAKLGGYAQAASVVTFIYVFGFVGAFLGPETRGKGLPEDADLEQGRARGFPVMTVPTTEPE